ncbi:hypothetical protein EAO73_13670 [Streptomyces sp. col6]|nr:hypothetical protein EAO73_13670 [Streptomyces sp. col6]
MVSQDGGVLHLRHGASDAEIAVSKPALRSVSTIRFGGVFTDPERELATWQPTGPHSPGRIDASCILVYGLILEANDGAIVHAPLPTSPTSSAPRHFLPSAGPYGRRIVNVRAHC